MAKSIILLFVAFNVLSQACVITESGWIHTTDSPYSAEECRKKAFKALEERNSKELEEIRLLNKAMMRR